MSVSQPTESPFDHDRYFTFTVSGEIYNGSIHFLTQYDGKPNFVEVLRNAFFLDETYIEGENATYAPRVDANQFLTVAKKYYGLDPPG